MKHFSQSGKLPALIELNPGALQDHEDVFLFLKMQTVLHRFDG